MRNIPNVKAERYRVGGPPRSNCGQFMVPCGSVMLKVQVSDGMCWDHVSVSLPHRVPDYTEMEFIRSMFFRDDECVMQLSVPRSEHINRHEYVLHWWRPQTDEEIAVIRRQWNEAGEPYPEDARSPGMIPRPPAILV